MDIHRCRFVPYDPQPINALTFSHTSNREQKAPSSLRLAIGRFDGDIEIWNPHGGRWVQETILRGKAGTTIEQVAWTQDVILDEQGKDTVAKPGPLRLFSTGGSRSITEWDLARGIPKRHADGNSGDIWCFAAQPAYNLPSSGKAQDEVPPQLLAAGIDNGSIILFTTEDDDLRYLRVVLPAPGRKAKALSITWRDRNTVVAGYDDGTIRVVDVTSRSLIRSMGLGRPVDGKKELVWAVKCLPDGTILSGDGGGELKIWDSKNFSLVQRLKTHDADVLDVTANATGDMIFTVGVDRRTIAYKPLPTQKGSKSQRWAKVYHRRYHENDIKCAASYESKGLSVLITGGIDCSPIILPMRNWSSEYHRTLTHLPRRQQLSLSSKARLLVTWWHKTVIIYHVAKRDSQGDALDYENTGSGDYHLAAMMELQGEEYIQSASISNVGSLLVVATSKNVKMFQLRKTMKEDQLVVRTRPVEVPLFFRNFGARHVAFSPNDHWLCSVRLDNTVVLAKVLTNHDIKTRPEISSTCVKLSAKSVRADDILQSYRQTISCVAFSQDSRVLTIGDFSGSINAWMLEGHEDFNNEQPKHSARSEDSSDESSDTDSDSDSDDDSVVINGQKWIRMPDGSAFPRLGSAILGLSFRPQSDSLSSPTVTNVGLHSTRHNPTAVAHEFASQGIKVVAVTASHEITELDVATGKLSDWSRRNPSSQLPLSFTKIKDRVMGCIWDQEQRLFMYGPNWIYMLDLKHDLPGPRPKDGNSRHQVPETLVDGEESQPPKKRRRWKSNTGAGDIMRESDRDVGYGSYAVRHRGDEAMRLTKMDDRLSPASDEEENVAPDALMKMRRGERAETDANGDTVMINGDSEYLHPAHIVDSIKDEQILSEADKQAVQEHSTSTSPAEWHTFSYRSIYGIAPINEESEALEVVLIERPMHDINLPPRFEGGQDWEP